MSSSRLPAAAAVPDAGGRTGRPLAGELARKIEDRTARVGIIGLGYVGLPMTLTMAEKGYSVLGFDIDPGKIEALNKGRNYIQHLDGSRLTAAIGSGKFHATADFLRLMKVL